MAGLVGTATQDLEAVVILVLEGTVGLLKAEVADQEATVVPGWGMVVIPDLAAVVGLV